MKAALLILAALPLLPPTTLAGKEEFIAHEWGTFTSVQGSGGALLRWNPFEAAELPSFVYDRHHPGNGPESTEFLALASKSSNFWLQRMETPVIYFYPEHSMTVDVSVGLPGGLITEWYPQVRQFAPAPAIGELMPASNASFLRWDNLELLADSKKYESMLRRENSRTHYFAARETDSAIVRAGHGISPKTPPEIEKFLFYRGVGDFETPLRARFDGDREIVLQNKGVEDLRFLFVLEVQGGRAAFVHADGLRGSAQARITLPTPEARRSVDAVSAQLSQAVEQSLVAEGLYSREAAAMANTWRDSWFAENGVRVLYLLPRTWTDHVLPLTMNPRPRELVRVMLGRTEIFGPELERALLDQIGHSENTSTLRALDAIEEMNLGRFTEPALNRVSALAGPDAQALVGALESALRERPSAQR